MARSLASSFELVLREIKRLYPDLWLRTCGFHVARAGEGILVNLRLFSDLRHRELRCAD